MKTFTLKELSIVQHLTAADKVVCKELCMQIFYWIFLDSVTFSNDSMFHVSGKDEPQDLGQRKSTCLPGTCL
jgi:hypothetical protein